MTDAVQNATTLRVQRTYQAPAQRVFDAWTSEEVMRRWWHAGGPDWENTEATVDLRVGGRVHVTMRAPDGTTYGGGGEYTEIVPGERLAFTWTWDGGEDDPGAGGLVEVAFAERDGATTVVLTHRGLGGAESTAGHADGWSHVLDSLGRELEA